MAEITRKRVGKLQRANQAKGENSFCDSLFEIISTQRLILFAGAGVSTHAGLADWRGFVAHLITIAEKYERETAAIMSARTNTGLLADAVSYYLSNALRQASIRAVI